MSLSLRRTLLARVSSSVVFNLYVVIRVVADIRVVCLFYKSCEKPYWKETSAHRVARGQSEKRVFKEKIIV